MVEAMSTSRYSPELGTQVGGSRSYQGSFLNVRPSASADGNKLAIWFPHGTGWKLRLKNRENYTERARVPEVRDRSLVPTEREELGPCGSLDHRSLSWGRAAIGSSLDRVCNIAV